MDKQQQMVAEFHAKMDLYVQHSPAHPETKIKDLRLSLIQEEVDELAEAMYDNNMVKVADGLGDILYVVYGCALAYGLDMEPILAEIHRSNMTKQSGLMRIDGKQMKGQGYEPPVLEPIIAAQERGY